MSFPKRDDVTYEQLIAGLSWIVDQLNDPKYESFEKDFRDLTSNAITHFKKTAEEIKEILDLLE